MAQRVFLKQSWYVFAVLCLLLTSNPILSCLYALHVGSQLKFAVRCICTFHFVEELLLPLWLTLALLYSCPVCLSFCLLHSSCFSVRLHLQKWYSLGFSWILTCGLKKTLPFKSYVVKKPIANEFELTFECFFSLPRSTKHGNNFQDNWRTECCLRGWLQRQTFDYT